MVLCCNLSEILLPAYITGVCTLLAAILSVCIVMYQIKANKKFVYEQKRKEAIEDVYSKLMSNLNAVLVRYKLFARIRQDKGNDIEETQDYLDWVDLQKDIIPLLKEAQTQLGYLEIRYNKNQTMANKINTYSREYYKILTEYNSGNGIDFDQVKQKTEDLQKNVEEDLIKLWNNNYN